MLPLSNVFLKNPMSSGKATVSLVFFILLILSGFSVWIAVLRRRNHSFITSRGIWSLLLTCGIWSIFGIFWNASVAFNWNCLPVMSIAYLFHCIIAFYFIERCFNLIIQFSVNKQAAYLAKANRNAELVKEPSIKEDEKEKEKEGSKISRNSYSTSNSFRWRVRELPFEKKAIIDWIFEHRKYFDHSSLKSLSKLVALVFVIIAFVPGVVTFSLMENPHAPSSSQACFKMMLTWQKFALVTSIITCIFVIDCSRRLLKVKDSYFIKSELVGFAILLPLVVMVFIYLGTFPENLVWALEEHFSVFGVTVQGIAVFYCHGTMWFILYKIQFQKSEPSEDSQIAITTILGTTLADIQSISSKELLIKVLQNRRLRSMFKEYLISSFCVENLLFWEAVEGFRLATDTQRSIRIAIQILEEYCIPNAHFLVNISGALIKKLNTFFETQDHKKDPESWIIQARTLLYEAQDDTFSLMCHDSFRRFLSDYFKDESKKANSVQMV